MLVIDAMHCVLEGLVHYHFRKVLRVDAEVAKKKERGPVAFEQDWVAYDPSQVPPKYLLKRPEKEEKQIFAIQARLVAPLVLENSERSVDEPSVPLGDEDQEMPPVPESGENPVAAPRAADNSDPVEDLREAMEDLRKALMYSNLTPLRFVAHSLGLDVSTPKLKKVDYANQLITWVSFTKSIFFLIVIIL
jgi:hypothetical protein